MGYSKYEHKKYIISYKTSLGMIRNTTLTPYYIISLRLCFLL